MAVQTKEQMATAERAAQELGYGSVAKAKTAIAPENLADVPEITPAKSPAPDTGTAALGGVIDAEQDAYTKGLEARATEAGKAKTQSLEEYLSTLMSTPGEAEMTTKAYARGGVDDIQKELDSINQEIRVEQNALRRQIERIQDNAKGLFGGAVEDEVARVERDSLRKQADLSIIQMGIQGRYDSAKAIADRSVAIQFERQEKKEEALKLQYEANKDLFTTAEQRAFESAQTDRQNKLQAEKDAAKEISDISLIAMQEGASGAVIRAIRGAKTPAEAQAIASDFLAPIVAESRKKFRQTQVVEQDGRKLLIDLQTGEVIKDYGVTDTPIEEIQNASKKEFIDSVDGLKTHKGLNSSVGPIKGTRIAIADQFGAKGDFIASVQQLTGQLTLKQLQDAKAQGATFGALSNAELQLLAESATKISQWARNAEGNRPDPEKGELVQYYDVSEKQFKKELDKISNYQKLDYVLKGGDPTSVGIQQQSDGTYWVENSDGTMTKIR